MPPTRGGEGHTDTVSTISDEATVLFVTSFERVESRIAASLPAVTTTFAATTDEAYATFDETTVVVCLFDNLLTESFEQFRTDVLVRYPFCQFVVVESDPLADDRVDGYDVVLDGPVAAAELAATVRERAVYAMYSTTLQEYYHLNTRVAALSRLRDDDAPVPDHVADRMREIRPRLQALQADLTESQLREISQTVEQHRAYVNQPTLESEAAAKSKYHPGACPECGVVWGDDHGNELGRGFEALGAGVWKCARCETVVHDLHDSNQSVRKW